MTHETDAPSSLASFSRAVRISWSRWNVILSGRVAGLLAIMYDYIRLWQIFQQVDL
jgi:hypothetical protein